MIPPGIAEKIGRNLHTQSNHPLEIIKRKIYACLPDFKKFDAFIPEVPVQENFDALLIPEDHPSRRPTDTFYVNDNTVLRTHTSAHQHELLVRGYSTFLVTGDVYRRDTIDRYHYPIFHQMEGVSICGGDVEANLKRTLLGIVDNLFGKVEHRWAESYFPFTTPSWELEIKYQDEWLEVLGCGCIHPKILAETRFKETAGWAFGLGLERLAMILFQIPDIRYFWSPDPRFLEQFRGGDIVKFEPFSNHPSCYKDISFWTGSGFTENTFFEIVREQGKDLVESIKLVDEFQKEGRTSRCYRVTYRSVERSLTNDEINALQELIRNEATEKLGVAIR